MCLYTMYLYEGYMIQYVYKTYVSFFTVMIVWKREIIFPDADRLDDDGIIWFRNDVILSLEYCTIEKNPLDQFHKKISICSSISCDFGSIRDY